MSSQSSISFFSLVGRRRRRLWERYTEALIARPLLVKGSTASFIFFVSDSVTQRYVTAAAAENDEKENVFDWARAGSGAAFGVVATGWLHYWWNFLEVAVGKRLPVATHRFTNTITKVAIDQLVGAPIYIFTYYVITHGGKEYMATLRNNNNKENQSQPALQLFRDTCTRAADMLPPTMLRHWTLWPAVHTLNFYYNPLHHRVLVQNLVLVGWSAYLSHLNNGGLLRIMTPEDEVEVAVTETVELLRRETSATKKGPAMTKSATTTTHHTTEVHILPAARKTASAPVAAATKEYK